MNRRLGLTTALAVMVPLATTTDAHATPWVPPPPSAPLQVRLQPVELGERPHIRVQVPAADGVEDPTGRIQIVLIRTRDGFTIERSKAYTGAPVRFVTRPIKKPGGYTVVIGFFTEHPDLISQSGKVGFRVKRSS